VSLSRTSKGLIARIEDLGASGVEGRTLRRLVLDVLRPALGVDAYAWLLCDPASSVGTSPLAAVPWFTELPRQIRLKYATVVNRWTALSGSVATLDRTTGGDRAQSLVWRDLLAGHGVGDVASVVFRDRYGCWAFLELWRDVARGSFSTADVALLEAVTDPLTTALRRRVAASLTPPSTVAGVEGPVVLLLDPDLGVQVQTESAAQYLRQLVPPDDLRAPVPAGAYNVAAQLLAVEAGVDDAAPTARAHVTGGQWVTFRAARIGVAEPAGSCDIAVTIEAIDPLSRADLLARACGLSPREREVFDHLVAGRDTTEVSRLMFVSPGTVQDHLTSVFDKTGVRSRRTLLARALGTSVDDADGS
jgi:DNA-binding CsgD family transcriptional regulator